MGFVNEAFMGVFDLVIFGLWRTASFFPSFFVGLIGTVFVVVAPYFDEASLYT